MTYKVPGTKIESRFGQSHSANRAANRYFAQWSPEEYATPKRPNVSKRLLKKCQHKWIDDSHAGPESGDISLHCKKCGIHHHVILY